MRLLQAAGSSPTVTGPGSWGPLTTLTSAGEAKQQSTSSAGGFWKALMTTSATGSEGSYKECWAAQPYTNEQGRPCWTCDGWGSVAAVTTTL